MYVSGFETISVKIVFNSGDFSDLDVAVDVIGSLGLLSCYKVLGAVYVVNVQAQVERRSGFSLRNRNFRPPKGRQSLFLIPLRG